MQTSDDLLLASWLTDDATAHNGQVDPVCFADLQSREISDEAGRFLQVAEYEKLLRPLRSETMLTVWDHRESDGTKYYSWCALVPLDSIPELLSDPCWWQPTFGPWTERDEDSDSVIYVRWASGGYEPLVVPRDFHGVREECLDISEDFRMFHNLYHDRDRGEFVKIADNGEETVVVRQQEGDVVKVRIRELKEFLSVKNMALCVFSAHDRKGTYPIASLGLSSGVSEMSVGEDYVATVDIAGDNQDWETRTPYCHSRFRSKKIIRPYDTPERSNFGDFKSDIDMYETFIVKTDEDGNEITSTCNPREISKFAPIGFYTPISFSRDILNKYQEHGKYELSRGGFLRCGSLWGIPIDTGNPDKVCAFLGDIGEKLPYSEQQYWKKFNIASESGMSGEFFAWQHLGYVGEPWSPEFCFIARYKDVTMKWAKQLGWNLFRPLSPEDKRELENIPLPDSQQDLDRMVLTLAKVLCDAINIEAEAMAELMTPQELKRKRLGKIKVLDRYLANIDSPQREFIITWLMNIQALRSAGSAHLKQPEEYYGAVAEFKKSGDRTEEIGIRVLGKATAVLDALEKTLETIANSNGPDEHPKSQNIPVLLPSSYRIIAAKACAEQQVFLQFADGSEGIVDMNDIFGDDPLFADLKDPVAFADFQLIDHTIQWGDHRDISNHQLYELLTGSNPYQ